MWCVVHVFHDRGTGKGTRGTNAYEHREGAEGEGDVFWLFSFKILLSSTLEYYLQHL